MGKAAAALAKECGYVNAGTVEFLMDSSGDYFFLEVNARLQVEHTVTEEVYGVDLVACQLRIASGDPLGFDQSDLVPRGHAIECRINAEDPALGFAPRPGRITRYIEPAGVGIRVDSGYSAGDEVPGAYDSLVGKLIVWGSDRDEARRRMSRALREFRIEGIPTTIPAHLAMIEEPTFVEGTHTTRTLEAGVLDELVTSDEESESDVLLVGSRAVRLWHPSMAAAASAAVHGDHASGEIVAPMQGTIVRVLVEKGQAVDAGEALVVLEAMKMESSLAAPRAGTVTQVSAVVGGTAAAGEVLVVVE